MRDVEGLNLVRFYSISIGLFLGYELFLTRLELGRVLLGNYVSFMPNTYDQFWGV